MTSRSEISMVLVVDEKPWKIEDGKTITITDPSGMKRFMGTHAALLESYVWMMQEYDRLREDLPLLPPRIEAALRYNDFKDEEDNDPQVQADKLRIRRHYDILKQGRDFVEASSIARQEFVADLLRGAISPLQRSAENRLTTREADERGHYCPCCRFMNHAASPILYSCAACGKEGYDCCINRDSDICYECEGQR
jgi:hypothetical protein